MPPQWPTRAVGAIRALFRSLQDIDIFVEDAGSEAFYSELLRRVAPEEVRVQRVFPLSGRHNVLATAAVHDFQKRRALFLVDGDFEWVRGDPAPVTPGVYRLECYCVENLLVCPTAAVRILMECKACTIDEATRHLQFKEWRDSLAALVDLFATWAALNKVDATIATVSTGLGRMLDGSQSPPTIDPQKVATARADAEAIVAMTNSGAAVLRDVRARVEALPEPLDIVSGKDFVLPALDFHLRSKAKDNPSRNALRFRLALHAGLTRFVGLRNAILRASRGENVHS